MVKEKWLSIASLALSVLLVLAALGAACTPKTEPVSPPSPAPSAFSLSDLSVQPMEVKPGEKVVVTAKVGNSGDSEGSYTVELKVNDVIESTQTVTVAAKSSQMASFTVVKDNPGDYSVTLGGLSGRFAVTEPAVPVRSVTWSDAIAVRFLMNAFPMSVNLLPDNKVYMATSDGWESSFSFYAFEGKMCLSPASKEFYDLVTFVHGYTRYDKNKLLYIGLPPEFDPREEFAPDVDKLPFIESIVTSKGEATINYRWP